MSKEYILKFAKGRENEPNKPLPVYCMYDFDEETREITVYSCTVLSWMLEDSDIEPRSFFITDTGQSGANPTNEELNKAINDFLGTENVLYAANIERKLISTGIPLANREEDVDLERDPRYYKPQNK